MSGDARQLRVGQRQLVELGQGVGQGSEAGGRGRETGGSGEIVLRYDVKLPVGHLGQVAFRLFECLALVSELPEAIRHAAGALDFIFNAV